MSALGDIHAGLAHRGYHYLPEAVPRGDKRGARAALLALAQRLGALHVPAGLDADAPVIETRPAADAPPWRPFDRPESIGWHNDFSTHASRPQLSLVAIVRADPAGPAAGGWRVASTDSVVAQLGATVAGRALIERLQREPLPFGYLDGGSCAEYIALQRPGPDGWTLRYYGRALREGAALRGWRPGDGRLAFVQEAIAAIEDAANSVGVTLPARDGALLIVDNERCLHDRTRQSVDGTTALRMAHVCFITRVW